MKICEFSRIHSNSHFHAYLSYLLPRLNDNFFDFRFSKTLTSASNFAGDGGVQREPSLAAEEEQSARQAKQVGQPVERDEELRGEGQHEAALPGQLHGATLISAGRVIQSSGFEV